MSVVPLRADRTEGGIPEVGIATRDAIDDSGVFAPAVLDDEELSLYDWQERRWAKARIRSFMRSYVRYHSRQTQAVSRTPLARRVARNPMRTTFRMDSRNRNRFDIASVALRAAEQDKTKRTNAALVCPCYMCCDKHLRRRTERVLSSPLTQGVIVVCTLFALFADDVWQGGLPKSADSTFEALATITFFVFLLEITAMSSTNRRYIYSYLWALDLLATLSMILEIRWMSGWMLPSTSSDPTVGVDGSTGEEDLSLARAGRAARAGTRVSKLLRLLRVLQLVRVIKLWSQFRRRLLWTQNRSADKAKDGRRDVARIGQRSAALISMKIFGGIIIVVLLLPMLMLERVDCSRERLLSAVLALPFNSSAQHVVIANALSTFQGTVLELELTSPLMATVQLTPERVAQRSALRATEVLAMARNGSTVGMSGCWSVTVGGNQLIRAVFDQSSDVRAAAWLSCAQTLLIVVLMAVLSAMFVRDLETTFIAPLAHMQRVMQSLMKSESHHRYRHVLTALPPGCMESSEVMEAIFKNQHRQDEAKHQRELDLIKKGVVVDLVSPMEQAISTLVTMRNNGLKKAGDAELQEVITLLTSSVAQGPSGLWDPQKSGAGGATEQHSETQKWLMSEVHGPAHADNSVAKDAGNSKRVTRIYRRGQDKDASLGVQVLAAGRYLRDEKGAPGGTAAVAPALQPALLQMLRTIATHTPEPEAPLVQPWSFDVFKLAEVTGNAPLQFMGPALFVRHGFISRFDLNEAKLAPFFAALGEGYDAPGNSYHNSSHATSVAVDCNFFLMEGGIQKHLEEWQILALLFAATIHDYDHPGTNNNFEIARFTTKALTYNDQAVLENHHCSSAFQLSRQAPYDFLERVCDKDRPLYRQIRACVVQLVLSTDLKGHFAIVSNAKAMHANGQDLLTNSDMVLKLAIKSADIAHVSKEDAIHQRWSSAVIDEFFKQGDQERKLGFEISPFMDRQAASLGKCQTGFFDFIAKPLFEQFYPLLLERASMPIQEQLEANLAAWRKVELSDARRASVQAGHSNTRRSSAAGEEMMSVEEETLLDSNEKEEEELELIDTELDLPLTISVTATATAPASRKLAVEL